MFDASDYWITVVEMPEFDESVGTFLTEKEREGLTAFLARHPAEGMVLADTGGVRCIVWPAIEENEANTQRSSYSVIYFYRDLNMPLYLLACLSNDENLDFSQADRAAMRSITTQIIVSQWSSVVTPLVKRAQGLNT